mmetsp:Transcript_77105/g.160501  ORF Transcript_77105/g.160501 Transcript_77105/m.160501 type:complete len:251 (+) Transcript_77105:469-1221(+)
MPLLDFPDWEFGQRGGKFTMGPGLAVAVNNDLGGRLGEVHGVHVAALDVRLGISEVGDVAGAANREGRQVRVQLVTLVGLNDEGHELVRVRLAIGAQSGVVLGSHGFEGGREVVVGRAGRPNFQLVRGAADAAAAHGHVGPAARDEVELGNDARRLMKENSILREQLKLTPSMLCLGVVRLVNFDEVLDSSQHEPHSVPLTFLNCDLGEPLAVDGDVGVDVVLELVLLLPTPSGVGRIDPQLLLGILLSR